MIYTDSTVALLAKSNDGNQFFFIAYAYNPNYIYALHIQSSSNEHIIAAFHTVFNDLIEKRTQTCLQYHRQSSGICNQNFPQSKQVCLANHRAPQSSSKHSRTGHSNIQKTLHQWIIHHWLRLPLDQLAKQAEITCNLLHASRINPTISAYHELNGKLYNWNAQPWCPLAPPGTHAVVKEHPATQTSWVPQATDAWYLGPALNHYRCFYIAATKGY